jgi:pimeloyl-ACP methyl ester carboxylesterase
LPDVLREARWLARIIFATVVGIGSTATIGLLICAAASAATVPRCRLSTAGAEPTVSHTRPPLGPVYFASDFPRLRDDQWGYPVGGFGGLRRHRRLTHTPVIFVHGNQADAQNWLDVMQQFQNDAGYTMEEMYALSYNGLGNYYAGLPTRTAPGALDRDYVDQNPNVLANGGHGSADDDEVPDLCRFIEAVQRYTGSARIDIVAHSLGVTIARKLMFDYPALARDVVAFVGIAGANRGTTSCRGLQTTYYGCNEIVPGSPWLAQLNGPAGVRETYPPTRWMTVYDGFEGDPFYVGPDAMSPRLRGADNRAFPGAYHNDLRVDPAEVDAYLAFLLRHGQRGLGADRHGPARAARIQLDQPDGLSGPPLCGVPALTGDQGVCRTPALLAARTPLRLAVRRSG